MNSITITSVFIIQLSALVIITVTSQECKDNAGSLRHDDLHVAGDVTFIFADREYEVECERIVVAWEFCYRLLNNTSTKLATFYPSIWMPNITNGTLYYTLIQSSPVTFTPAQVGSITNNILCPRVNLSTTDQFTAPAGSVVGLYSFRRRHELELLRTNRAQSSITTYRLNGNHSSIRVTNDSDTGYNIALRVHLATAVSATVKSIVVASVTSTTVTSVMTATMTQVMPSRMTSVTSTTAISILYSSVASATSTVVPNNSGSSSDSGTIIGGAVGVVVILLIIIVELCILILTLRWPHRKKDRGLHAVDNTANLNADVTMEYNPSYDVTKANTVDYDTINPGGSDVPITTNPSYNVHTKPYSKTSEDEYNYVQPNDVDGYLKIYPNTDQSHGIRGILSHSTANSTNEEEYEVVNQP